MSLRTGGHPIWFEGDGLLLSVTPAEPLLSSERGLPRHFGVGKDIILEKLHLKDYWHQHTLTYIASINPIVVQHHTTYHLPHHTTSHHIIPHYTTSRLTLLYHTTSHHTALHTTTHMYITIVYTHHTTHTTPFHTTPHHTTHSHSRLQRVRLPTLTLGTLKETGSADDLQSLMARAISTFRTSQSLFGRKATAW